VVKVLPSSSHCGPLGPWCPDTRLLPVALVLGVHPPQESLALMLEMAQLRDDSLREYDDLETVYLADR